MSAIGSIRFQQQQLVPGHASQHAARQAGQGRLHRLPPGRGFGAPMQNTPIGRGLGNLRYYNGSRQVQLDTAAPPPHAATGVLPGAPASDDTTGTGSVDDADWLVGDGFKEIDRKELRTVFDHARWKRHRSSSRYLRHMKGFFSSRILRWVAAPLAYVMTVALGVALYHAGADAGLLPAVVPQLKPAANVPFSLTSFALSTLLVLRTNTSYQRWDEARKMWGLVVNRTRDITRQAMGYIPANQPDLQDMFLRWTIAFPRSLKCHLREGEDIDKELGNTLKPEELAALKAAEHRPNYVLQVMTAIIKTAQLQGSILNPLDPTANLKATSWFRMDENLTQFEDVTGGCERILRTPVPLAYTRHNSRFLMIWLTLLPFTLWDTCGWFMLPVTFIVSFLLLGIKEIGVTIEEPFSILPLEVICNTIETNVRELHATHSARGMAAKKEQDAAAGVVDAASLVTSFAPASKYANGNSNGNGNGNSNGNSNGYINGNGNGSSAKASISVQPA